MANQEQLRILKQGVDVWNQWRSENIYLEIDLSNSDFHAEFPDPYLKKANLIGANLINVNLSGADLSGVRLTGANFREANLKKANLNNAYLSEANFESTNLERASLERANLERVDLGGANLQGANLKGAYLEDAYLGLANLKDARLEGADLRQANLISADLTSARLDDVDLYEADFTGADLKQASLNSANLLKVKLIDVNLCRADFTDAAIGETIITNVDFSETVGLERIKHSSSTSIDTSTLQLSKGKLPKSFLRGCGLPDWEIESAQLYNPDINNEEINKILYRMYDLRASQSLQISSLFISYSHTDSTFVDRLESYLNDLGIRFWRDIHDAKAGRLEKQIDRAIRLNPTVLLVLSKHSLKSDWVEHEVRTARELEKEMARDVLCPVALDDSWKNSSWEKRIMEQITKYNVLDFSGWKDDEKFEDMFKKLIDGLKLFYK
jgi:uncharacterized protein YjbI with pentapeptide repeats